MANEWKPNAPNASQHFKETQPDREKEVKKDVSNSVAVTKKQLAALEAQRAKPAAKLEMSPKGAEMGQLKSQEETAREKKIAEVRRKLNAASNDMNKRFNRSR